MKNTYRKILIENLLERLKFIFLLNLLLVILSCSLKQKLFKESIYRAPDKHSFFFLIQ